MSTTRRWLSFRTPTEKANWLDAAATLDAAHPSVRNKAIELLRDVMVGPTFATPANAVDGRRIGQAIEHVFDWVRDSIAYKEDRTHPHDLGDPTDGERGEEFADSATILQRRFDDCDGKARLFVALVRAWRFPGVEARIKPVFDARGEFAHAQAEARWPGSERHPGAQPEGWVMTDPIVRNARFGQSPLEVARKPGGGWWVY